MTPTDEQQNISDHVGSTKSNLMIQAYAGCIADGTMIKFMSGNNKAIKTRPVEYLFFGLKPTTKPRIQCEIDGFVDYLPMIKCVSSGIKPCLRVETELGTVIATSDHEFKTDKGWKRLDELTSSSWILSRAPTWSGRKGGRVTIYSVPYHPFGYAQFVAGYGNYKRIHRARLVLEARMNNLDLDELILILRNDPIKAATLQYLDPSLEVHHKNEDPSDDRWDNLEALTSIEHRQRHNMHRNHARLGLSKVLSLTQAGEWRTYDIMMPGPHHNFLANGHVVHNCGKSSTLRLIDQLDSQPHLYLVYNKSNKDKAEAEQKVGMWRTTTQIKTANGLGHGVWQSQVKKSRLFLNIKKISEIFRQIVDEAKKSERQDLWSRYDAVKSGVEMARAIGYIPPHHAKADKSLVDMDSVAELMDERTDTRGLDLIDEVLIRSIAQAYDGIVDFNDQCYMPALFGGTFPRHPLVLVDEWQDLNPVQIQMIKKLKGRIIGVGDAYQAIYGFRGACEDSMAIARRDFSMEVLPLSISFRCPSEIVANVHWRVPSYKASSVGGVVATSRERPTEHSTVICRNNAPLFSLAIRMLGEGHRVDVSGVDLANRLTTQMTKLGSDDLTQSQAMNRIDEWLTQREEAESKSARDTAECMRIFVRQAKTLGGAIATVRHVAALEGNIKFLTGHKAKGLEWDHVYHLDSWLLKEKESRNHRRSQDPNLSYVIDTRTKDRLTYIDSKELK